MSKRAVIYARVSTDLQRDNYSIPSQVDLAIKYAGQKGYAVVGDRYVDPNTGFDTLNKNGSIPAYVDDYTSRELSRPGLDAAIDYLERIGFDILIVYTLDRLARDPYIRQTLEIELGERGAKVEYVLGNYDDTPHGEVRKDLDATFAKWENAIRVERFNRGKIRKAESGQFVTGPVPFGYFRNSDALGGLDVDSKQAEIVRSIFNMYVDDGLSIASINKILNDSKTPAINGKWAKTTLNRLLKNPVYIGKFYYNKTKVERSKGRMTRDKSEWVEIPTTPIIEPWVYEAAQERFRKNKALKKRQPKRFYLLSGMITCEVCGKAYACQTYPVGKQRRATELQTYRHRVKRGHCHNREIPSYRIEPLIWDAIVTLLKDPEQLKKGYAESLEKQKSISSRKLAHLETLKNRFLKLKQSLDNLNTAYVDPDLMISKTEYVSQKTRIKNEMKSISAEMETVEKELKTIPSPAEFETLEKFAAQVCKKLDSVDPSPKEKRKIFELLHVKVVIDKDGNPRIEGWFTSENQNSDWDTEIETHNSIGLLDRAS